MTAPRTWVRPLRLASHVRQSRVASADPHEQAPLSTARSSVPWSMKQCSCDRSRDSPPSLPLLSIHSPPSRSPPPPHILQASPRVVCRGSSTARSTQLLRIKVCRNPRTQVLHPCIHPWHSAHEDEPYHQQLSLSDRNDKIAWTKAECALAQPHTPRTPTH